MQQVKKKRPANAGKAPVKGAAPAKKPATTETKAKPSRDSVQIVPEKKAEKARDRPILYGIIVMLLVIIAVLVMKSCGLGDKTKEDTPDYEETVAPSYEPEADIETDETRLNLAIMPDYVVTKSKPDMLVPFPEQNAYDIDLTFCDPYTDEILYQTALISPGSVISVPAYSFVYDGLHQYRVEVRAFDRKTHEIVETAVAMEAQIMKK